MITLSSGLSIGLAILELLRNKDSLQNIDIYVRCFMNCRESGLTFTVGFDIDSPTFCIYEHRNSDEIIVNSKKGWGGRNGELPYKADSKHVYDKAFSFNEYVECADYLEEQFLLANGHNEIP